jgi:DNA-binding helix-hairpin-helix protein with protein kinase domain
MRVLREDNAEALALVDPPLGWGGEAAIHEVSGEPGLVAKVYHRPSPEQADKLAAMIAAPPLDVQTKAALSSVAWPLSRLRGVGDGSGVIGYIMRRVVKACRLAELANPRSRRQICPLFHYGYLVRTAHSLAAAVRRLHERGYILGDLNESNVLITPQARVVVVDTDSFQVVTAARVFDCRVGKVEYAAPELLAECPIQRRLPEHDAFALAVLIFQLLMQGLHPFTGVSLSDEAESLRDRIQTGWWPYAWRRTGRVRPAPHAPPWTVVPPNVQELFTCCFEDGHEVPQRRPSAAVWEQALYDVERELQVCAANSQHRYPPGLDECPWCLLTQEHGRDPFPPPEEIQAKQMPMVAGEKPAHAPDHRAISVHPPAIASPTSLLDPNDPLPPRPAPSAATVASSARLFAKTALPDTPAPSHAWAVWVAAGSIGAILGIVVVLWTFQPIVTSATSTNAPGLSSQTMPSAARSASAASVQAEKAWKKATADYQAARHVHARAAEAYERNLQEFGRGRLSRDLLLASREQARQLALAAEEKRRLLMEKKQLWEQVRQTLTP